MNMSQNKKYLLTKVDYVIIDNEPILLIRWRDEDGNQGIFRKSGFRPYFYAPEDEVPPNKKTGRYAKTLTGEDVVKVYVDVPPDVPKEREKYSRSYEADILFPTRFLIDSGLKSGFELRGNKMEPCEVTVDDIKLTKLFVDIETESPKGASDPNIAKDRILTISATYVDPNTDEKEKFMFHDKDERVMLKQFIEMVKDKDPDVMTAWYAYFDYATIYTRCNRLGIDIDEISPANYVQTKSFGNKEYFKCSGRIVTDLMQVYDSYYKNQTLETKRLEDVAENECGIEQSHFDYSKLGPDEWPNHIDEIKEYNDIDVQRMVDLDKKLNLIEHFDILRRIVGCQYDDTFQTSRYTDVLMLRQYNGEYVCPNKGYSEDIDGKYAGGYVHMPDPGIHEMVAMLDFSAMYPTIIESYNISPETLVKDPDDMDDVYEIETKRDTYYFDKTVTGKLPGIFEELEDYRYAMKDKRDKYDKQSAEWKMYDKKQYSLKQVIDGIYGFFGFKGSRFYVPAVPASTTAIGREHIKKTGELMENEGHKLIYGDTDSVMIELDVDTQEEAVDVGQKMEKLINNFFERMKNEEGLRKTPNIETEKVYRRIFFKKNTKKRYAGLKIWEEGKWTDEISITGFEAVRSDQAEISKEVQEGLFDIILRDGDFNHIHQFLNDMEQKVKNAKDIETIGQIKSVRKDPEDYGTPMSVHGVIWSNRNLNKEFGLEDNKPYILHLKKMNPNYPPTIELPKHKGGVPEERDVTRVALSGDDEIDRWKPFIDYDKHINKQIRKKVDSILESIGYSYSECINGHKQASLDKFMEN